MLKRSYLLFFVMLVAGQQANCQGCSDAGFCTMGSLQPLHSNEQAGKNMFKASATYGVGEQHVNMYEFVPEVDLWFSKSNIVQVKVPFRFIKGNLGQNAGVGDLSLSLTHTVKKTDGLRLDISVGAKIATGNSDAKENGLSLPMPYQVGLGTYDIIIGTSLKIEKWNFGAGYQAVLVNRNKNEFLHNSWSRNLLAQKYFESNLLDRGSDALLRLEKAFIANKINFSAGILSIYHLRESSFINASGQHISIQNSDGLTLNITGSAQYKMAKKAGLDLSLGFPVVTRKARPDGLTRDIVIGAAFNYTF